ncbi:uncharacterized protein N0V89_001569 [Didymosphaeria variabile]|uniref:Uncharacterized protein n=1 Tax=Didymosphaeria variabile TaxID=1932322 RepID=A0A9W8XYC7_9PLEO|nr:uncharacterized protein N0V89_001569 [Didymosphaeria variabile]KAJ4361000.1 hypothetical protein N0V89_001569 [Didymosphaeria variabile]
MDTGPLPTRIIRIDSRYRHQAQDVVKKEPAQVQVEEEEESSHDVGEPLLIREQKGRAVMGKAHRLFHRRSAQVTPNVKTVNVEVVATLDSAGNVVGQATTTPGVDAAPTAVVPSVSTAAAVDPSVATAAAVEPSVATAAAVLPSVPSVPPFPTDLNVPSVPAYPWPSGVPTAAAAETTAQSTTLESPESTPAATLSSALSSVFSTVSGYNSTTSSASSSTASSSASLSFNSTSSQSSSTSSSSSSSHSTSLSSTDSSITSSATSAQTTSLSYVASSTAIGGGAGGFFDPATTGAASPTGTTAPTTNDGSSGPLETPQVVGTVVGSLAGVALLLWLMLFLIKRHKRKQNGGALQLTGDDHTDREISQPMTQNAARTSFVPPSFLNRFSGASRSTAESSGTGEKSFQRISGRKLPSAFSEGMTSEQFAAGRGEGTLSGSSFYHDDKGWYGGPGVVSKDFGDSSFAKEIGETSNTGAMGTEARVRPSPAQTPVIHHPDDTPVWGAPPRNGGNTLSPPATPNPDFPPRGSLGRSHPSRDGSTISRGSRFTENV